MFIKKEKKRRRIFLIHIIVLIIFLLFLLLSFLITWNLRSCPEPTEPTILAPFERNDLVMVRKSKIFYWAEWEGAYFFYFEKSAVRKAYLNEVQIKFDRSLKEPIVKASEVYEPRLYDYLGSKIIRGVVVIFRDNEQKSEYWHVKEGKYS